ncbi:MAG: hypothetical protein PVH68_16900, partial [Armatimonadota bacterium]
MADTDAARQELDAEFAPLRHGIEAVRRRLLWSRAARNALLAAAALITLAIAGVLIGCVGPPGWTARAVLLAVAGAALIIGLGSVALPLLAPPSLAAAAAHIERAFPRLDDRLLSAVELAEAPRPDIHSLGFARALIADTRRAVESLTLRSAVDLSGVRRAAQACAAAACVCAVLAAVFPQSLPALFATPTPAVTAPPALPIRAAPQRPVVEATAPPPITDVTLALTPPSYSGLPQRTVTDLP